MVPTCHWALCKSEVPFCLSLVMHMDGFLSLYLQSRCVFLFSVIRYWSASGRRTGNPLFLTLWVQARPMKASVRIIWLSSNFLVKRFLTSPVVKWRRLKPNIWRIPCVQNFHKFFSCVSLLWWVSLSSLYKIWDIWVGMTTIQEFSFWKSVKLQECSSHHMKEKLWMFISAVLFQMHVQRAEWQARLWSPVSSCSENGIWLTEGCGWGVNGRNKVSSSDKFRTHPPIEVFCLGWNSWKQFAMPHVGGKHKY